MKKAILRICTYCGDIHGCRGAEEGVKNCATCTEKCKLRSLLVASEQRCADCSEDCSEECPRVNLSNCKRCSAKNECLSFEKEISLMGELSHGICGLIACLKEASSAYEMPLAEVIEMAAAT